MSPSISSLYVILAIYSPATVVRRGVGKRYLPQDVWSRTFKRLTSLPWITDTTLVSCLRSPGWAQGHDILVPPHGFWPSRNLCLSVSWPAPIKEVPGASQECSGLPIVATFFKARMCLVSDTCDGIGNTHLDLPVPECWIVVVTSSSSLSSFEWQLGLWPLEMSLICLSQ